MLRIAPQDEDISSYHDQNFLMLRSAQSARLEARTVEMPH